MKNFLIASLRQILWLRLCCVMLILGAAMTENAKRIPWSRRIRTRLTAAVLLAIILPLVIFYVISNEITKSRLLEQIEDELAFVSSNAAVAFVDLVDNVASNLRMDLHGPDFEQWSERDRIMAGSFLLRRINYHRIAAAAGRQYDSDDLLDRPADRGMDIS